MINAELLETIFNKLPKREFTHEPIIKLSKDEFLARIKTAVIEYDEYADDVDEQIEKLSDGQKPEWLEVTGITESGTIAFDKENCCGVSLREHNGYHFLVCESGGDWEWPVSYIIYPTEEGFEEYVPSEGNSYNKASMTAFGSEGEFSFDIDESNIMDEILNELCEEDQEYFENEVNSMLEVVGFFKATGEIIEPGDYDINILQHGNYDKLSEEFIAKVIE